MMQVIRSEERGQADFGWLDSKHTFSFGNYYNPDRMGFGALRVINEDRVQPGQGFGTHGHQDMEIISYVIDGALEHRDSMQNGAIMRPGDVQRMTAGTGVQHSEYNHSESDPVHFLQIWITPAAQSLEPGYEQTRFDVGDKSNRWRLVGSRDGREGSVTIHQDVDLYATVLDDGRTLRQQLGVGRRGWLQVVRGSVALDDEALLAGDAAAIDASSTIEIRATADSELLLFDLA